MENFSETKENRSNLDLFDRKEINLQNHHHAQRIAFFSARRLAKRGALRSNKNLAAHAVRQCEERSKNNMNF